MTLRDKYIKPYKHEHYDYYSRARWWECTYCGVVWSDGNVEEHDATCPLREAPDGDK